MSAAVCPACGVAVVPGYVRCPKCRKPLPRRPAAIEGGTAVEEPASRTPIVLGALAVLAIGGGIAAYVATRKEPGKLAAPAPVEQPTEPTSEPETAAVPEQTAQTPAAPTGPNAADLATTLERTLKRQRLWATVAITGARVDVRSMSCADAAMAPHLDEAASAFKAAGLTKLRCVEDSGRVVSDRDL